MSPESCMWEAQAKQEGGRTFVKPSGIEEKEPVCGTTSHSVSGPAQRAAEVPASLQKENRTSFSLEGHASQGWTLLRSGHTLHTFSSSRGSQDPGRNVPCVKWSNIAALFAVAEIGQEGREIFRLSKGPDPPRSTEKVPSGTCVLPRGWALGVDPHVEQTILESREGPI